MAMRTAVRRFELVKGRSRKFWEIAVASKSFTVHYGRIGTDGKSLTKTLASAAAVRTAADTLVAQKLRKGYREVRGAAAVVDVPRGPMTEALFWKLIGRLDWKRTGDDDAVVRPIVSALAAMAVKDIYRFDDLLARKLYALDTRAICRGVYRGELDPDDGDDYISADDFLYSRCVIVANGRKCFTAALARPMRVPQNLEFEALLYIAATAYEHKTGGEYAHTTPVSWESFSNTRGWKRSKTTKPGRYTAAQIPPGNRRPT